MSNAKMKAAEDFRALSRGFRAVIALADELDKVGSLEQAESELTASIAKLRKERESLLAARAADTDKAKAEAEGILIKAQAKADTLLADADAKAQAIDTEAQANAARLVDGAKVVADTAQAKAGEAQESEAAAVERKTALLIEIAELESKLDKLQAQARKLLGD